MRRGREKRKTKKASLFFFLSLSSLNAGAFRVEYHQFDRRLLHLSSPLDDVVALCGQGPGCEAAKRLFDDGGAVVVGVVDFDFDDDGDSSPDSRARGVSFSFQELWLLAQVRRNAILHVRNVDLRKKRTAKALA